MVEGAADPLERLAALAGLLFTLAFLVFLAGLAVDSPSTVLASFALGLLVTVGLGTAACWSAWRVLSWRSLFLLVCPLVAFPLSLRLSADASGIVWLASFFGLTALFATAVGIAAGRSLRVVPRAVGLSLLTTLLLGIAWILVALLLWRGDLN